MSLKTLQWIPKVSDHPNHHHLQDRMSLFSTDPSDHTSHIIGLRKTFARQPDRARRRTSRMRKRDSSSSNSTPSRRKPRCAETGKCMGNASLVIPVPMPTEKTNCKKRHIYQAILRLRHAPNSTRKATAHMEKGVSFCILFMTLKSPWAT